MESLFCNSCESHTNHEIVYSYEKTPTVQGAFSNKRVRFLLASCRGCNEGHLIVNEYELEISDLITPEIRFPHASYKNIPASFWILEYKFPELHGLLIEIYTSYNANLLRMTGFGIRALMEIVINGILVQDGGILSEIQNEVISGNLNKLQENKRINSEDFAIFKKIIDMGHASIHRGYSPDKPTLQRSLQVLENIIERYFIVPNLADEINEYTPPRPPKAPRA